MRKKKQTQLLFNNETIITTMPMQQRCAILSCCVLWVCWPVRGSRKEDSAVDDNDEQDGCEISKGPGG